MARIAAASLCLVTTDIRSSVSSLSHRSESHHAGSPSALRPLDAPIFGSTDLACRSKNAASTSATSRCSSSVASALWRRGSWPLHSAQPHDLAGAGSE